jgi:hypothetical protein
MMPSPQQDCRLTSFAVFPNGGRMMPSPQQDCRLTSFAVFPNGGLMMPSPQQYCRLTSFAVFPNGGLTQSLCKSEAFAGHFYFSEISSKLESLPNKNAPTLCVEAFVPRTGIEPALPCDNQILSLARLPIPPSGLNRVAILVHARKSAK